MAKAPILVAVLVAMILALPAVHAEDGDDTKWRFAEPRRPADLDPHFQDIWEWFRPGLKFRRFEYDPLLFQPLQSGNNNFFHHLLLLPPLEGCDLLQPEQVLFRASLGHSYCTDAGQKPGNRFRASFTEFRVKVGLGLSEDFEVRAGFNLAKFSYGNLSDIAATQETIAVFPGAGFNPSLGLGNIEVGIKIRTLYNLKYDIGLSGIVTLKIPVGKSDFLSSGRGDVTVAMAGTYKLSLMEGIRIYFHITAGWAFFDEENVFPSKVYVNSASFYGLSIVMPFGPKRSDHEGGFNWAVFVQMQGHENAFAKLDQFNSSPVTVHGGLRGDFGGWFAEAGVGFGMTGTGSQDWVLDVALSRTF